jgi:hypothetical protein
MGESAMSKPQCEHFHFESAVRVNRLTNEAGVVNGYSAEVTIRCVDCQTPFAFMGLPAGVVVGGAAASMDAEEGRFYIEPSPWHAEKLRRAN